MKIFTIRSWVAIAVLTISIASCKKDLTFQGEPPVIFPNTDREKQRVEVIKEVADILVAVYRKPKAVEEVNAAIKTGYYVDERVLLKDLIFPHKSPLYTSDRFKATHAEIGVFREVFLDALSKGNYPNLKAIIKVNNNTYRVTEDGAGVDSTHEIWTDANGVSIYFPYSDNFPYVDPNDPNNNRENGNLVTIVSADREADSAPGWEPYYSTPDLTGFSCSDNICYRQVTVDDSYAEWQPTHIVGVGAEPSRFSNHQPNHAHIVFIGDVKCTDQLDRLISFTGNGGGTELKFCRGSAYLTQDGNGQITSPQNVVSANPTRKQIRKGQWIPVNQIWDSDWQHDNLNQVFAIYEEDTQGSTTLNLSVKTTVKTSTNTTTEGTVGFSWTFKTQDDIIRQLAWNRVSFYQYNQGGLNNGCGTRMVGPFTIAILM